MAAILEGGKDISDQFVAFTDQDGERNWVLSGSIMLMESIEYRQEYEESAAVAILEKKTKMRPRAMRAAKKNGN